MSDNSAFSAGVRFGGLTDRTEIKILLCYMLANAREPLTSQQITDAVSGQELANYFELQDALSHLVEQNLVIEEDDRYSITDEGVQISKELEKSLPFSVKDRAYKTVISMLQYESLRRQNKTCITPVAEGGYNLNCTISDADFTLFSFDIHMPNEKSAKLAEENFIKYGQDIFRCVLGITTENPDMYRDFLEKLKKD